MDAPVPRITIVTPCYNHAPFVGATIESVLRQDYPNLEYLVLDGGSTDGSADIIRSYETTLSYWHSRKDRGQSDAINQGFGRATGDIFGWINSDDRLKPGALRAVASLLAGSGPDAWLIGASELTDKDGSVMGVRAPQALTPEQWLDWRTNWFAQQATFFTRGLWRAAGGLRRSLHYAMDYDLWLRMRKRAAPVLTDRVLAEYRYHPDAKCIANPEDTSREIARVAMRHSAALIGGRAKEWRKRTAGTLLAQAREHYELLDHDNALADLREALRADPHLLARPGVPVFAVLVWIARRAGRKAAGTAGRALRGMQIPAGHGSSKVTFVLPNALGVSGVNGWLMQLSDRLMTQGMNVGVLEHEDRVEAERAQSAFPRGTTITTCRGPKTNHADLHDVMSYLPSYVQVCPTTIVPNWSHAVYAACALLRSAHPDAIRVIGYAHSDEACYYRWLAEYEPIIDRFVAVSAEIGDTLARQIPHRADDIVVRPYAVATAAQLRRDYSPPERPLQLMYAGRIEERQKRITALVTLAEQLVALHVDFELSIVGVGVDDAVLDARLASAVPAARARIRRLGRVPYAQMPALWRSADVCVLTSLFEGTSVAMLEAMAQGCVPIVTAVSGVAGVLQEGVNGNCVPPYALDAMPARIQQLAADREALRRMGGAAFETVRARFSFDAYAPWFADTCRELWERAPRAWPEGRTLALPPPRSWLVRVLRQELGLRRRLRRWLSPGGGER